MHPAMAAAADPVVHFGNPQTRLETEMKTMIAFLIAAMLFLTGCNTVRGLGQDIEDAGGAIKDASS
jgi:predicted small secreted protein